MMLYYSIIRRERERKRNKDGISSALIDYHHGDHSDDGWDGAQTDSIRFLNGK
jgi:hypothetical protein